MYFQTPTGETIAIPRITIEKSKTLQHMIDDTLVQSEPLVQTERRVHFENEQCIPTEFSSEVIEAANEFNEKYRDFTRYFPYQEISSAWIKGFFDRYGDTDQNDLFIQELLNYANFYENELLLNAVARKIATIINGLSDPSEIRLRFNLPNNLEQKSQ